ncbi:plasmid recombination protein [Variovorax sp. PvP013]|uniref:plasmid recombination protein n=1 Tax=Variovorax sp. PvP013 TaxID=3156435 RepID=UPI003D220E3A
MAESIAHFAVKSIGLSRVNGRKPCTLLDAARHNLREIQAEQGATGRIDPTRIHSNMVLHGPSTAAEVCVQAAALQADAGIVPGKLRRDHCQAIEAVFSLPENTAVADPTDYFAKCLSWLAGALDLPVLSAVVHLDESAMHLHVLLLPVKGGAHVGSAPIDRAALKRLRENFFAKVAGLAGLKHAGAKMRGIAKQWAIAAVFRRCKLLEVSTAIGPLWPYMAACIERDPTGAMLALGIDVNTIRPSDKSPLDESPLNPIAIGSNPIGFQNKRQKPRTLSCVGFAQSPDSKERVRVLASLDQLWRAVGWRTQSAGPYQDRLRVARTAQQQVVRPSLHVGDDGWTRERDEYSHDSNLWD